MPAVTRSRTWHIKCRGWFGMRRMKDAANPIDSPKPTLLVVHGKVGFDERALSLGCRIAKYQVIFLWLVLCRGYGVIHRLIVRRIQLAGCCAGSMVQKVIELLFVQYHHVNVSSFVGTGIRSPGKRAEVSPQFRTQGVGRDNKCELGIGFYRKYGVQKILGLWPWGKSDAVRGSWRLGWEGVGFRRLSICFSHPAYQRSSNHYIFIFQPG